MISLEDFISVLRGLRSQESEQPNSLLLKGLSGMSMTTQMALGSAFRRGLNVDELDMEEMNFTIHGRLALSGIQVDGGLKINREKAGRSTINSIFADYQLEELYLDWKAGFEASEHYQVGV